MTTRKQKGRVARSQTRRISLAAGSRTQFRGGPGIGPLRKGELAKHGYSKVTLLTVKQRHTALNKAIKEFGSLGVWRKLNAVSIYTRRTSPGVSKLFKEDMNWIRNTYGIKAF